MNPEKVLESLNHEVLVYFLLSGGLILIILITILTAYFLSKLSKNRNKIKIARIQSGNLDPIQTKAASFFYFRRGIILIFVGLNIAFILLFEHPGPLLFLPFTIGLAYLAIFFIHKSGWLELFPRNGDEQSDVKNSKTEVK